MNSELQRIESVENCTGEPEEFTILVEWKRSRMWGSNPTAAAVVPGLGEVSSGSIGGAGYDKLSTAVAEVLNQIPCILKKLYELKNEHPNTKNHDLFGYGSGYGLLPYFEGGVGVSCYPAILEKIGYEFKQVASGKNTDVFQITKNG